MSTGNMIGKINIYQCKAGHNTVTVDGAEGMTPFKMRCREPGCELDCKSSMYPLGLDLLPEYEWVKPTAEQIESDLVRLRRHSLPTEFTEKYYADGGLLLQKIEPERLMEMTALRQAKGRADRKPYPGPPAGRKLLGYATTNEPMHATVVANKIKKVMQDAVPPNQKRNALCACGSGKKYKSCCRKIIS